MREDEKRTESFEFKMRHDEKENLRQRAKENYMSMSDFARVAIEEYCKLLDDEADAILAEQESVYQSGIRS